MPHTQQEQEARRERQLAKREKTLQQIMRREVVVFEAIVSGRAAEGSQQRPDESVLDGVAKMIVGDWPKSQACKGVEGRKT